MSTSLQPGKLVSLRGRDWVVLPSGTPDLLVIKPLGGSDQETTGIYLPLEIPDDIPQDARFPLPAAGDLGDISTARLLYDAARLAFRNGAGPFRALAKLSFRPRAYQIVPLVMALRQDIVRLLIADDVGVGKTVEALLVLREMMERARVTRFAVICLPHLCDQWQQEFRAKLGIEAVIIRSNTQARLDRMIQGDTSVYDYYPYQIISIDYIKSDSRRAVFVEQCPELVIVDEAHTCTRPAGASKAQQQRYHLLRDLADKPRQHLVLLTATPHSGKPEEFHSLLGLLKPEFETLDLPSSNQSERRILARHFVQRKRADMEKWMGEDTPFPDRDTIEWNYDLSPAYAELFNDVLDFARKLVAPQESGQKKKRVHYWTALGLLRGVMSSPGAGVKMFATRLDKLVEVEADDVAAEEDEALLNPVGDDARGMTPVRAEKIYTVQQPIVDWSPNVEAWRGLGRIPSIPGSSPGFPPCLPNRSGRDSGKQICPIGVVPFDQRDLPIAPPALHRALSLGGRKRVFVGLEIHEPLDAILACETRRQALPVGADSAGQVFCQANVKRPVWLASKDVHKVCHDQRQVYRRRRVPALRPHHSKPRT